MCEESWVIGERGFACVIVTGYMKRVRDNSAESSPINDEICDFDIDYVEHTIKIQIGAQGEAAPDTVKFSQAVDFQDFYPSDNAFSFGSSLILAAVGIFATVI